MEHEIKPAPHGPGPPRRFGAVGRAVMAALMLVGGLVALAPATEAGASPPLMGPVADVTVGSQHVCAVTPQGSLRCWGTGSNGRLGDGTNADSSKPVGIVGISDATQVSGAGSATCAVVGTGEVRCWGKNTYGGLGDGTTDDSSMPVAVANITDATEVTVGATHACALIADGTVECWGRNSNGQLGNGTTNDSAIPVTVSGITTATSIDAYFNSNCALLADGTVTCWGQNSYGQLGNGTTDNSKTPVPVSNLTGATSIAAGQYSVCATAGITARCWGRNDFGQLGDGTTNDASVPVVVMGITGVADLAVGKTHACIRSTNGAMACWGGNSSGQLGDGTTTNSPIPQVIPGFSGVTAISAGGYNTCAATTTLHCWGANQSGQIGNGNTDSASMPKLVIAGLCEASEDPGFSDVPAGAYYESAVAWQTAMGISAGTGGGKYSPHAVVNRRNMAVFIWSAFDQPDPQGTNPFSDIPNGQYYTDAVLWLAESGISSGTGSGKFSPNAPVTRRDMAVFLHKATNGLGAPPHSFTDVPSGAYYEDAVSWLAHTGISAGTGPGVYSPNTNVARRDMAVFLNRRGCGTT